MSRVRWVGLPLYFGIAALAAHLASPLAAQDGVCATRNCDANGDTSRNVSDAISIFGFLFLGGPSPAPYCEGVTISITNGDCNGDGNIDLSDGVRLLSWLFGGLPEPVEGTLDSDSDEIPDGTDNCPMDANPGQEDADTDGVGDACDACPKGSDTTDGDGDGAPDACDNCPEAANAGQEDADSDGVGDACEQAPTTIYAGSLTRTRGRWQYVPGEIGLAGANSLCAERFAGASVCTIERLQEAAAAGELVGATDFEGNEVTSYWVHRPDAPLLRQCADPSRENIPWTYLTAHIDTHGEFVTLGDDGSLGEIDLVTDHCQASRWVACCNP